MPVKSYKTTQLRRDRFKKPLPSWKSDPSFNPVKESKETKTQDESGLTTSHSATELQNGYHKTELSPPLKDQETTDPILSYITTARYNLGMDTKPERSPSSTDAGVVSREMAIADSGPITGVKDLKLLSRRLSSMSDTTLTHSSVEFVYALRKESEVRFNPYDLSIVSAEKARSHQTYYTISPYSITKVNDAIKQHLFGQYSRVEVVCTFAC